MVLGILLQQTFPVQHYLMALEAIKYSLLQLATTAFKNPNLAYFILVIAMAVSSYYYAI